MPAAADACCRCADAAAPLHASQTVIPPHLCGGADTVMPTESPSCPPDDTKMPPDLKPSAPSAMKPKLMSLIIETAAGQKKRELTGFEHNPAASQKLPPKKLKLGPATCDGCGDDARWVHSLRGGWARAC